MKKILSTIILITMLLSLCACQNGGGAGKSGPYDPALNIFDQADSINKNDLTEEEIAKVEARVKADGYVMSWKSDGTMNIDISDEVVYIDSEWPESRFTNYIPKPEDGFITSVEVFANRCTVLITWSGEQAKAYAEIVKGLGFDQEMEETDVAPAGMYLFYAKNADGVEISINRSPSTSALSVTIPE